jgi:hypothetical protein
MGLIIALRIVGGRRTCVAVTTRGGGLETGKGLQPCKKDLGSPGKGESKYGPVCASEPDATHIGAYGNGTDKRNHLHLMVVVGVNGQLGDVHLSHVIEVVKEVVFGKIH